MLDRLKRLLQNRLYAKRTPVVAPLPLEVLTQTDKELSRAAVSAVIDALDDAKGDRDQKMLLLPTNWRAVNTLFTLDYQVCNGGFHQFFTNTGGAFDSILIDDVSQLGDSEFVSIVTTAFREYEKIDFTDQWENRGKSWEYFTAPNREGRFQSENKAFYAVRPRMNVQIGTYVRSTAELFTA